MLNYNEIYGNSNQPQPPPSASPLSEILKLLSTGFQLLFKMLLINWSTL